MRNGIFSRQGIRKNAVNTPSRKAKTKACDNFVTNWKWKMYKRFLLKTQGKHIIVSV